MGPDIKGADYDSNLSRHARKSKGGRPIHQSAYDDRENMKWKVDRVWGERFRSALRRAERPLSYQKRMLGECDSDGGEPPLYSRPEDVRSAGKTSHRDIQVLGPYI